MRLYGKKILRRKVERQVETRKEMRDAIITFVDLSTKYCLARIQGTDTGVYCTWPSNWRDIPRWMTLGNAVTIKHTKGNPHKWEIYSDARTIPTPQAGSLLPTQGAAENGILDGMQVTIYDGLTVTIADGTYRLQGAEYNFTGLLMGNTSFDYMGEHPSILMGMGSGLYTLDAAPSSPNYRIDMLSINSTGNIVYTKGTASTNPSSPTCPDTETLITYIIVPYGTTSLKQSYIGNAFVAPFMATLTLDFSPTELAWGTATSTGTITILDQYDKPFAGNHNVTVSIESGNGYIDGAYPSKIFGFTTGTKTFTFTRVTGDGSAAPYDPTDNSPVIKAVYTANPTMFFSHYYMLLYDEFGDILHG